MLEEDSTRLRELYLTCRDVREKERFHALYCVSLKYSLKEVSELFCRNEDTVSAWVKSWLEEKRVSLEGKSGRPPTVSKALEKELCRVVEEDAPENEGFQVASWDCMELSKWLALQGASVSPEWIRVLLKRNGFHYVKTKYNFLKKNNDERLTFVQGFFEETPLLGLNSIFFEDECAHKLHPKQGGKWTRSKEVFIDTNCSHARVTTAGVVCPETGEVIAVQGDKNNAETFINLLKTIEEKTKGTVHLILDNYMVHKSKAVREHLLKTGRIILHFLPTYSPDLNPIEWLWAWVRRKRTNNVLFQTKEELKQALQNIFDGLSPPVVRRVCSYEVLKHRIT